MAGFDLKKARESFVVGDPIVIITKVDKELSFSSSSEKAARVLDVSGAKSCSVDSVRKEEGSTEALLLANCVMELGCSLDFRTTAAHSFATAAIGAADSIRFCFVVAESSKEICLAKSAKILSVNAVYFVVVVAVPNLIVCILAAKCFSKSLKKVG